jgi:hypothetical protein
MVDNNKSQSRIEGKVAGVLTLRELVINRGTADGVEIGMRFAVLNRQGIDIKDPDSGQSLGSVELVKTIVKIVRIQGDHLAVGRTFRTIKGSPGLSALAAFSGTPDRAETLAIEGSSLKAELSPEDSLVKPGDPVVQTMGDEYDDL